MKPKRLARVPRLVKVLGTLIRLRNEQFFADDGKTTPREIEALKQLYLDASAGLTPNDLYLIGTASFEALVKARRLARGWDEQDDRDMPRTATTRRPPGIIKITRAEWEARDPDMEPDMILGPEELTECCPTDYP